jgi:signal recognition particle subunit SEC65
VKGARDRREGRRIPRLLRAEMIRAKRVVRVRAPLRLSLTAFTGVERPTTPSLARIPRGVSAETKTEERR